MRYLAVICVALTSLSGDAAGQNPPNTAGHEVPETAMGRQAVVPFGRPPSASNMTHEETMVRTAYAKFAYAAEQDAIDQLAMEAVDPSLRNRPEYRGLTSDQRLAAAQVSFALGDFVIGNIGDILRRKAVDLITPASGEMLTATTPVSGYAEGGTSTTIHSIRPSWQPARVDPPETSELKLDDLYQRQWHTSRPSALWQRYASYSVTVTFQGKSRGPYMALFIFGHDEKTGNEVLEPEDSITDVIALASAMHEHLFPEAYISTRLRRIPVVADWINARKMSGPDCSVGMNDVCCDLVKMQCGPGKEDVEQGLARGLPAPQHR